MRLHHLRGRQHVHDRGWRTLWWEVRREVEERLHPSEHCSLELVKSRGLSYPEWLSSLFFFRYMTLGNHDYSLPGHEWYQVEYSAIQPRWKLPCLTHSFNVSTPVSCSDCVSKSQFCSEGHLRHVCVHRHHRHWWQQEWSSRHVGAPGQRAGQGRRQWLEDRFWTLPVPFWWPLRWLFIHSRAGFGYYKQALTSRAFWLRVGFGSGLTKKLGFRVRVRVLCKLWS